MTRQRLFCLLFGCALLIVPYWFVQAKETVPTYESKNLPFDPSTVDPSTSKTKDTALGGLIISPITMITLGQKDPVSVTIGIINLALTFLGFGFLVLLIYAGALWVLARGNEEEITKAKAIIKRSLIGLIIILGAFGLSIITFYVITYSTYGEGIPTAY